MANQSNLIISFFLLLSSLFLLSPLPCAATFNSCSIDAIYQLGDSLADTGNLIRESSSPAAAVYAHLPYGESFLGHQPTGRCSNGLLMVDYVALALGLPLLNPYLEKNANFSQGVNFAVAGSTALNASFLAKNNINSPLTNSSLFVQLNWFKTYLESLCSTKTECEQKLERSLVVVGEIGGNDYNYALLDGKTIDELQGFVHYVVNAIKEATREAISLGAVRVVVPGNWPIGCFPIYLTAYQTNATSSYDEYNCLKVLNDFAMFHNDKLQQALRQLREEYPTVAIVYADYYKAFNWVFHEASLLGFEMSSLQKACCGDGGIYNFDLSESCGSPSATVCPIPDRYISWDGIHLTQEAYKNMADWLIQDITPKIKCPTLD